MILLLRLFFFVLTGIDGLVDMKRIFGITAAEERDRPVRVGKVCMDSYYF